MAVSYDENVIVSFADRLYRRASSMAAAYALFGMIISALPIVIAMLVAVAMNRIRPDAIAPAAIVVGLIGGVIGAILGSERAFTLRLLAQQALCQVQIERNTRPAAMGMAPVRVTHPPPIPRG